MSFLNCDLKIAKRWEIRIVLLHYNSLLLDTPSSLLLAVWLLDEDDDDDLFLSREDEPPVEYDEYDDGSLSCLLFVLEEILFTFLLLLLLELCLLSFSLSFEEDDEDVLDVEMTFDGTLVELLE